MIIRVTEKGHEFLKNPHYVTFYKDHDYSNAEIEEEEESHGPPPTASCDQALFDLLKQIRKQIAKQKGLPPYVIFQDPSMEEMATTYPTTEEELAQVNGVGIGKVKKFGKPFLETIKAYVEENDIITAADVVVKTAVNKSKIKIFIIQQVDKKVDLDEIAEAKSIDFDELLTEIEHICDSGTKLNLDYYIEQILDDEKQDEIYDYFMEAEDDDVEAALDELGDDEYNLDEIRLMRIKFMSEVAL
jgi:ATP-dependent DNA helicase RecQ